MPDFSIDDFIFTLHASSTSCIDRIESKANHACSNSGDVRSKSGTVVLTALLRGHRRWTISLPIPHSLSCPHAPAPLARMGFFNSLCETLTRALGLSAMSPWRETSQQQPLAADVIPGARLPANAQLPPLKGPKLDNDIIFYEDYIHTEAQTQPGPIFHPPNASPGFLCDYSAMKGWRHSGDAGSRNNWLSHGSDRDYPYGGTYDIFTDYAHYAPTGTVRKVMPRISSDGHEAL